MLHLLENPARRHRSSASIASLAAAERAAERAAEYRAPVHVDAARGARGNPDMPARKRGRHGVGGGYRGWGGAEDHLRAAKSAGHRRSWIC
jgi:hypothetical protein